MKVQQINRREFLAIGAAAACMLPARRTAAQAAVPPSRTVTMAIIGYGGRGRQMLPVFLGQPGVRFLAVCDAIGERRAAAKKAVDDRWHARLAIAAMRAGKDVYCEKPIALSIAEGEAVMRASELYQRIYQGGVQRRNVGNFVTAMKLASSGRLGRVHTVHAGMAAMGRSRTNTYLPEQPLPTKDAVDWDMWIGPAPMRPYNAQYTQGAWHSQYDFHGDLTEWGSHTVDLCQLALGRELTAPVRYVPVSEQEVHAFYSDGLKMVFRQHGFRDSCAIRLEGDEGWVETDDSGGVYVSDPLLLEGHTIRHESWSRPVAHPAEFVACVRSRLRASAPADALHFSHVACHAATVAYHLNRELKFDLSTCTFSGDAEATARLTRSNRAPWLL